MDWAPLIPQTKEIEDYRLDYLASLIKATRDMDGVSYTTWAVLAGTGEMKKANGFIYVDRDKSMRKLGAPLT